MRAYSGAAQEGLKASTVVEKCLGRKLLITTDYNGIGKLQYIAGQMGIVIRDTQYTDQVTAVLVVPADQVSSLEKQVTEKTSGRAQIVDGGTLYYAMSGREMILFD